MSYRYGPIRQLGYVVRDVRGAIVHWAKYHGVGPFILFEEAPLRDFRYRGKPTEARVAIALGQSGSVQIELIMPLDENPSLYREHLEQAGEGLQHVAYWTTDFAGLTEHAQKSGLEEVLSGYTGDPAGRFAYYMGTGHMGSCIEISALSADKQRLFDQVANAARDWAGDLDTAIIVASSGGVPK